MLCEKCPKPLLHPGNHEVLAIYNLCKTQIIVAPEVGVIGLRMDAALTVMGWLGVIDQELCWRKLQAFCEELFKKDK